MADRTALYAHWPDGGVRLADKDSGSLTISAGTAVDLSTFFNAFSHRKWALLTGIGQIAFEVAGHGRVRIRIVAIDANAVALPVAEEIRTLDRQGAVIRLKDIGSIPGTILGVRISAPDGDVRLDRAAWTTDQPPLRAVSLAAVVTTFRRERAVLRTIETFSRTIIPGSRRAGIHLYVVDNARSLRMPDTDGVTLIPNDNLGGAGGFTRGLLEARDTGKHTHILFMDDDAECDPESVWRTAALAAYLKDPRAAIAGAMLYRERPTVQHEKGAVMHYDGKRRQILELRNHRYDLAHTGMVATSTSACPTACPSLR